MASGSGWNLWAWLAGGCGWNLWVWLVGVVIRRYIDFLILLIPTPLVSVLFLQQHPYFLFIFYTISNIRSAKLYHRLCSGALCISGYNMNGQLSLSNYFKAKAYQSFVLPISSWYSSCSLRAGVHCTLYT